MTRRATVVTLTVLSLVAFAARVAVVVYFQAWRSPQAMEHKTIAVALVAGHGFTFGDWNYYGPTSVQSPTFPFLLAGLYEVHHVLRPGPDGRLTLDEAAAERAYFDVMLLNAAAGAALVWLTYATARTVGAVPAAALVAAALVAVWPTQVYTARVVQAISVITCGLALMTVLYYRAVRTGSPWAWAGFSVVGAASALTEPVFLPALAASGVLVLLARQLAWRQRVRNGAILAVAVLVVIGPWAARNYVVHGKLIPVKGSFWVNVWKGNNDFASGTDRLKMTDAYLARLQKHKATSGDDDLEDNARQYDMLDLSQRAKLMNKTEPEREAVFRDIVVPWIKAHPKRYLQLCGIRLVKTITIDWDNPKSVYTSYKLTRAAILLMTAGGLVVAWRQRWSLLFPGMVLACALLTYTLTVTAARFAFPFEPVQLTLGGGLIVALYRWATGAAPRRPAAAGRAADPAREPAAVATA